MLAESDSRSAAIREFSDKARLERAAFTTTLTGPGLSADERRALTDDFNTKARQAQKDFEEKLPTRKKSASEQALEDFDKKAERDLRALSDSLGDTEPTARVETVRQFQNTLAQRRARLQNDTRDSLLDKRRQFKRTQTQNMRAFFES